MLFLAPKSVEAATCTISTDTVVTQSYVNSNSCTTINIQGNVSTTWVGTVDLGGGTVTVKSTYTMTMGSSSQMVLGTNDDFVVESNATTTHLAEDPYGIQISARNITVSGRINANERGCRGGVSSLSTHGYWPSTSSGICTAPTSTAAASGRSGGGGGAGGTGASHAGVGGTLNGGSSTTTHIYGDALNPSLLGSGGGGGYYGTDAKGGNGGGRISLTLTGTLTVTGSISANGGAGRFSGSYYGGGGGSGGSINIVAPTVSGSGTVSAGGGAGAAGGASEDGGGGGGGGRIAFKYDVLSDGFSVSNITAAGGSTYTSSWRRGGNGTTYILNRTSDDGAGTITVTSGFDFPFAGDYTRDAFSISSGARLGCPYQSTGTTLEVSSVNWMVLSGVTWECGSGISSFRIASTAGISTTSTSMLFTNTTSVRLEAPIWTNVTTTITNSWPGAGMVIDLDNALTMQGFSYTGPDHAGTVSSTSAFLIFDLSSSVSLVSSTIYSNVSSTLLASVSIDANSVLSASGRGCWRGTVGGNGYGPHTSSGVCTVTTAGYGKGAGAGGGAGGGAAHGGAGGRSESSSNGQTATYGTSVAPTLFGSGGGSGYDFYNDSRGEGGDGGGMIMIRTSGALTVAGVLTADGAAGNNEAGVGYGGGGGGSGGSIYLYVGSLLGNGTVSAKGGSGGSGGTSNDAGGGGGGRIAIYYSSQSGTAFSGASVSGGTVLTGATAGSSGSIYTYQTNQLPDAPTSFGSSGLTNGSTTGTTTPIFTFTLSDGDVVDTVKFQIQIDDSSDFGSPVVDYISALAAQGSFSFQVGQAAGSGSYSAGSNGQTLSSGSYYWRVKAIDSNTAESSYTTANSGSVAFIIDSAARTIGFDLGSGSALESVTATSIRISLNTTHFETVTVNYAATGGTADGSGADYTLASGTATITAGDTSTTVALSIANDSIDEPNETIVITLSSPLYASIGSTSTYTYTITDNDTSGITFSKSSVAVTEGGATDSYTVVLDSQPTSTIRLSFSTSTLGVTLSTSTVEFTSSTWSTPVSVTVTATNDEVDEQASHTSLIVSVAAVPSDYAYGYDGLTLSDLTATITDNDTAGVTLSKSSASVTEGGATDSYTVVLTSMPTSTVSLTFTTSTYGVTLDADAVSFNSLNWNTPQTITITATDDLISEGTHTALITHAVSVATDYAYGYSSAPAMSDMTATIADNDTPGVIVSKTSVGLTESGTQDTYTIVLTSAPTSTVMISITASESDVTTAPTSLSFTSGNWNIPQTVTVSAVDDPNVEGDQTRRITHVLVVSSYAYGYSEGVSIGLVSVSITDNDAAGGGASAAAVPFIPLPIEPVLVAPFVPPPPISPPVIPKPQPVPTAIVSQIEQDQKEFRANLSPEQKQIFGQFITQGTEETSYMNARERRSLVRDALDTLGEKAQVGDLDRIAKGMIPQSRNLARERDQLARVRTTFKTVYGRDPNFKNQEENLAWNAMMYRLRFPRDLVQEREGVGEFRKIFNRLPQDPFQWAVVRVLGYVKN